MTKEDQRYNRKDKDIEEMYGNFAKFYLAFFVKLKLTIDLKVMDGIFHTFMSEEEGYDYDQVELMIENFNREEKSRKKEITLQKKDKE